MVKFCKDGEKCSLYMNARASTNECTLYSVMIVQAQITKCPLPMEGPGLSSLRQYIFEVLFEQVLEYSRVLEYSLMLFIGHTVRSNIILTMQSISSSVIVSNQILVLL